MVSDGRTDRLMNYTKNTQSARLLCGGGVMSGEREVNSTFQDIGI